MKKEKEDLKSALANRIDELGKELERQMQIKEACQGKIKEIDTRCTQIIGALHELQKLNNLEPTEDNSQDNASDQKE